MLLDFLVIRLIWFIHDKLDCRSTRRYLEDCSSARDTRLRWYWKVLATRALEMCMTLYISVGGTPFLGSSPMRQACAGLLVEGVDRFQNFVDRVYSHRQRV